MARYIKDFQIGVDSQTVHLSVNQYLQSEGYEYINYDGEKVFKKGKGVLTNPSFFKFSYSGNVVRMETWMKFSFFPGVYVGELGITGFVGSATKGPWKKRIANIEAILSNYDMQTKYYHFSSPQNTYNNFGNNETQLLNENGNFKGACILGENKAESIPTPSAFCSGCGTQLPEGTAFCSVCGKKRTDVNFDTTGSPNVTSYQQTFSYSQTINTKKESPLIPGGYPVSRKEFINKYAQPSLKKILRASLYYAMFVLD